MTFNRLLMEDKHKVILRVIEKVDDFIKIQNNFVISKLLEEGQERVESIKFITEDCIEPEIITYTNREEFIRKITNNQNFIITNVGVKIPIILDTTNATNEQLFELKELAKEKYLNYLYQINFTFEQNISQEMINSIYGVYKL